MEIRFLSVGCGDGIHIRYLGSDALYYNIFIDGGVEGGDIYTNVLRKEIEQILANNERINLWIITHIDDDHIGGILRFIKDTSLRAQLDLSKTQFWFNYGPFDYDTGLKKSNLKSVRQGMRLREFLKSESQMNQSVSADLGEIDLQGCKITVLTPDKDQLEKLYQRWLHEETIIFQKNLAAKKIARPNDYHLKLGDFDLRNFSEDHSEFNASSITLLVEFNGKKVLLLADSHPSKVYKALIAIGYSTKRKLKLSMMQLAHHGSKFNTNDDLLQIIDCADFVISADGFNIHNLPHKELIARLRKNYPDQESRIHITHKNNATASILKADGSSNSVCLRFPALENNYIKQNL